MDLKNISEVKNKESLVDELSKEYNLEDLIVKTWRDEECRNQGISELYFPIENTLNGIIYEAKNLVDKVGYASVEVIFKEEDGEETVLYFYDVVDEMILANA